MILLIHNSQSLWSIMKDSGSNMLVNWLEITSILKQFVESFSYSFCVLFSLESKMPYFIRLSVFQKNVLLQWISLCFMASYSNSFPPFLQANLPQWVLTSVLRNLLAHPIHCLPARKASVDVWDFIFRMKWTSILMKREVPVVRLTF